MSRDGLNAGQANKFCRKLGLKNLRLENGIWTADDDGEPYKITAANYWAAWHEGDLR